MAVSGPQKKIAMEGFDGLTTINFMVMKHDGKLASAKMGLHRKLELNQQNARIPRIRPKNIDHDSEHWLDCPTSI